MGCWEGNSDALQEQQALSPSVPSLRCLPELSQFLYYCRGSQSVGHDHFYRGHLRHQKTQIFTLQSITVANYNYEVATEIILWLGVTQHEELY